MLPAMGPVPWQVAYGHWIGWTAAAVFVILGCALYWLWIRWLASRRGKATLAALGNARADFEEGPVVIKRGDIGLGQKLSQVHGLLARPAADIQDL